eukprot:TRINITY_DN14176_c0_g10_i1.p1 TRINITY_DN14176_c0_g10~~TRINITY_DN14176_c0_g10_i1.p1  ORF type:complete len:187 (-),score=58.76 TRINITY_DN14176_c0_g10_i1:166-699(-)
MCIRDRYQRRVRGPTRTMLGFRDVFDQIDSDQDGSITRGEFQKALCGRRKEKFRAIFDAHDVGWKDVFQKMDSDRNGTVSFEEFRTALEECLIAAEENMIAEAEEDMAESRASKVAKIIAARFKVDASTLTEESKLGEMGDLSDLMSVLMNEFGCFMSRRDCETFGSLVRFIDENAM